jgi:hypothetical protein
VGLASGSTAPADPAGTASLAAIPATAPGPANVPNNTTVRDCFRRPLQGDTDPDDDGLYEDTTGDGNATFADAVELAFAVDDAWANSCPRYYDFDNDSHVYSYQGPFTPTDFDDPIALAFSDDVTNATDG